MNLAFLILLQLVQYNFGGKHYLVETEDENGLEENSPESVTPSGQVCDCFHNCDGTEI